MVMLDDIISLCLSPFRSKYENQAREEAQSALDTVEGFAALNRKLMDELRLELSGSSLG